MTVTDTAVGATVEGAKFALAAGAGAGMAWFMITAVFDGQLTPVLMDMVMVTPVVAFAVGALTEAYDRSVASRAGRVDCHTGDRP